MDWHPHYAFITLLCKQKDLIALLKVIWSVVIDFFSRLNLACTLAKGISFPPKHHLKSCKRFAEFRVNYSSADSHHKAYKQNSLTWCLSFILTFCIELFIPVFIQIKLTTNYSEIYSLTWSVISFPFPHQDLELNCNDVCTHFASEYAQYF